MHFLRRVSYSPWLALPLAVICWLGTLAALASPAPPEAAGLDFVVGTWTGTSTCVGDRPACKNETVVFRIVPVEGKARQVRMLGDKIVDGKRLPMGALLFDVDTERRAIRCEFKVQKTHGVWSFTVADDSMEGTLVVLPEGTKTRDVAVHRANDEELPEAPPVNDYGE